MPKLPSNLHREAAEGSSRWSYRSLQEPSGEDSSEERSVIVGSMKGSYTLRMKINFRRGLLGALLLLLTACSYKTADSSCVADDPNTMNPCTGCPSVSGEDTSLRCLADNGDGEIYVDYDACRHSDFTFTDEFACSRRAVLVAHAYGSKPAKKLIPYGDDAIKKFPADSDFYVFATNRENDSVLGLDIEDPVSLGAEYASIVSFLQGEGY